MRLPAGTRNIHALDACTTGPHSCAMRFFSDNAAPVSPAVMAAIIAADHLDTAYDGDAWSGRLDAAFSDLFETPCEALWVTTGTAANCLALAALCPPHGGVLCHEEAHVEVDEGGAPEFFTHGAKLMTIPGEGAKLTPQAVQDRMARVQDGVHWVRPHALTITNATEYGLVYTPDEVAALGAVAREHGLGFHMDGARFANAVATLGCSPADLTWRAGIDALSFGFTKNGGMSAEALVFFRPGLAADSKRRRKRSGHLLSKGRYLAAQILALLERGLWLDNARGANAAAAALGAAAGGRCVQPVEANEVFVRLSAEEAAHLRGRGYAFYDWGVGEARFVTAWNTRTEDVAALAAEIVALG
jgi:threonine aldolase